jgi:parallel beta-helix repeat protein
LEVLSGIPNYPPTQGTPILNATNNNVTNDNLTVYNVSTFDIDNNNVKNIYNWYLNGSSIAVLNMPMEGELSNQTNVKDYSSYSNNGTNYSATWNGTGGYDGFGAFEFDGINDYIEAPGGLINSDGSLSFWAKVIDTSGNVRIFTTDDSSGGVGEVRTYASALTRIDFYMGNGTATNYVRISGLDLTKWSHYTYTWNYDGTETNISGYYNGDLLESAVLEGPVEDGDLRTQVGAWTGTNFFNGSVDDLIIFNRTISPEQARALYENKTNFIHSSMTNMGEVWNVTVTPNDGYIDGATVMANNITILEGCTDADGDGWNTTGVDCGIVDCDDTNATIRPILSGEAVANASVNIISTNITLCTNTYYFNLTGDRIQLYEQMSRAIMINFSNGVIDCDGSTLVGNGSNIGMMADSNFDNITILNCNFQNFTLGIAGNLTFMANNLFIKNNTFANTTNYSIGGSYAHNLTLIESTVDAGATHGISLAQANKLNLTNNTFGSKVLIQSSEGSTAKDNLFTGDLEMTWDVSNFTLDENNLSDGDVTIASTATVLDMNSVYTEVTVASAGYVEIKNSTFYAEVNYLAIQGDNISILNNTFVGSAASRNNLLKTRGWGGDYIRNSLIKGNWFNITNSDYGIRLDVGDQSSQNMTIINNTFISGEEYGVYLGRESGYTNLSNNYFNGSFGGIYVWNYTGSNNYFNMSANTFFEVNNSIVVDLCSADLNIKQNRFENTFNSSIILIDVANANVSSNYVNSSGYGIFLDNITNSWFTENNFSFTHYNYEDGNGTAIIGGKVNSSIFDSNFFENGENSEILLSNVNSNNFTNNILNNTSGGSHLSLSGNINVLAHNIIQHGGSPAMQVVGSDNVILNNTIFNQPIGMILLGNNFTVYDNNLTNLSFSYGYGNIHLWYVTNSTVYDNNVSDGQHGIVLNICTNVTLYDNTIWDLTSRGIWVQVGSNHTLYENNITAASDYGILINYSNGSLLYNNWLSNTNNAYDNSTNYWNTSQQLGPNINSGQDIGGNYFSDYTGYDHNGDGIGDNVDYLITGGSVYDHLPLVNGWGNTAPTYSTLILNSTLGVNLTTENLTVYNQSTYDEDLDSVKNIINWKKNGTSILVLNMPFDINGSESDSNIVKDYSGSGNNGTVNESNRCNGQVWNRTNGHDGFGAYEFDGYMDPGYVCMSDHVSIPFSQSLNLTEEFTFESWVYVNGTPSGKGSVIMAGSFESIDASNRWGWYFGTLWGSGDNINFAMTNISEANTIRNETFFSTYLDEWVHVAGVFKGGEYMKMYFNGDLVNSSTDNIIPYIKYNNTFNYTVGVRSDNLQQGAFNGTIDDVRIWNVALSNEQVRVLYENRTDLIVSQETAKDEVWQACITPNDGWYEGLENCSLNLTILNVEPEVNVSVKSYSASNYSTEDIYANWTFSDDDEDLEMDNQTKWYKDEVEQGDLENLSIIDDGNLSGGEVWKVSIRVNDGSNWSSWANASITLVTQSTPTETTTSGGGGGGGGGIEVYNPEYGLLVTPELFYFEMIQQEVLDEELTLTNLMIFEQDVGLEVKGVKSFVTLEEYDLTLDKEEEMSLEVYVVSGEETGTFTGMINVSGNNTVVEVPIVIGVDTINVLFDAKIDLPVDLDMVKPGDVLPAQITVFNVGTPRKVDVLLNYYMKDMDNNVLWQGQETVAVEGQYSFTKPFNVPYDLESGLYVLALDVVYVNSVATSSTMFTLLDEERALESYSKNWYIILVLIFLVLVIVAGTRLIKREYQTRWKR